MTGVTATTDLRLHVIGGFELTVDGHRVGSLQPAAQRLVAFVALAPHGVERDYAAFQLWPGTTEERARANLRSSLWRIRRVAAGLVETCSSRLCLGTTVWVDARDGVEGLLLESDGADLDAPLPFQTLMADLLPDWYDDWLTIERERLRQLTLRVLDTRARRAIDDRRPGEAIQLALTAMAIDPLRAASYRLLMEAHLAEGNEHDARRTLDGYRLRLGSDPCATVPPDLVAMLTDGIGRPVAAVG